MRLLALILILLPVLAVSAEEAQRPLDPTKPADALILVDALTQDVAMPRKHADAFRVALATLARLVESAPAPTPVPAAPAKGSP